MLLINGRILVEHGLDESAFVCSWWLLMSKSEFYSSFMLNQYYSIDQ